MLRPIGLLVFVSGTLSAQVPPATPPGTAPNAAAQGAPQQRPGPRPFAEVTKGAEVRTGFFDTYDKDDKVWIAVPRDRLGKDFLMRRLLIDHARARCAARRGGGAAAVELTETLSVSDSQADALTELDDALRRLEHVDARQSAILEQRFFGGLSLEETAEAVGVSLATVKRDLRFARAWLAAELSRELTV